MTNIKQLPLHDDACWQDPSTRNKKLLGLIELHQLTSADVAKLTGKSVKTVHGWRDPGKRDAITIESLRALIYDLRTAE